MEEIIFISIYFAFCAFLIYCYWLIFKKAGRNGWEFLIPIWNIIVLFKIAKMPLWCILGYFVPIVNIFVSFKLYTNIADSFGKSTGFGLGLFLLPFIFVPILAFGNAEYDFDFE